MCRRILVLLRAVCLAVLLPVANPAKTTILSEKPISATVVGRGSNCYVYHMDGSTTKKAVYWGKPRLYVRLCRPEDALEQLIFLPRMSRERVLQVVSQCDAFLDTYPWGGGVTVLESLSMCTPVVVLPRKTTILQLGLGHLRTIGLERDLAARDVDQFGAIAARLGTDNYFRQHMRQTICTRKKLLFMHPNISRN